MTPIETFEDALREHIAALQARDIERFARTLSRSLDVQVIGPHGEITTGYDAIRSAHADWFAAPQRWSFEPHEIWRRSGSDLAIVLYTVTYRDAPDVEPIRFLLTLGFARETDGLWRFIYDQNTPLA